MLLLCVCEGGTLTYRFEHFSYLAAHSQLDLHPESGKKETPWNSPAWRRGN